MKLGRYSNIRKMAYDPLKKMNDQCLDAFLRIIPFKMAFFIRSLNKRCNTIFKLMFNKVKEEREKKIKTFDDDRYEQVWKIQDQISPITGFSTGIIANLEETDLDELKETYNSVNLPPLDTMKVLEMVYSLLRGDFPKNALMNTRWNNISDMIANSEEFLEKVDENFTDVDFITKNLHRIALFPKGTLTEKNLDYMFKNSNSLIYCKEIHCYFC